MEAVLYVDWIIENLKADRAFEGLLDCSEELVLGKTDLVYVDNKPRTAGDLVESKAYVMVELPRRFVLMRLRRL